MVHNVDVQSQVGTLSWVELLTVSWATLVNLIGSTDLFADFAVEIAVLEDLNHRQVLINLIWKAKNILRLHRQEAMVVVEVR